MKKSNMNSKKTTAKKSAQKLLTKEMFAVVQTIYDREDLEDSEVTICGVYSTKKTANQKCAEAKKNFLEDMPGDPKENEAMLDDDCDRLYNWYVTSVKVEV